MAAKTMDGKITLFIFGIIAFWFGVIFIFAPVKTINTSIESQMKINTQQLGSETANTLARISNGLFVDNFVNTGLMAKSEKMSKGADPTGTKLFDFKNFLKERVKVFWSLLYYGIYRIMMYIIFIPYVLPLMLAFGIHSFVMRKILQWQYKNVSAFKHTLAKKIGYRIGHAAMLLPFLPIAISPYLIPLGYFILMVSNHFIITNISKRI